MWATGTSRLRPLPWTSATRWFLLSALVAGILGMHILTGGDAMDHHRAPTLAAASTAGGHSYADPTHVAAAGSVMTAGHVMSAGDAMPAGNGVGATAAPIATAGVPHAVTARLGTGRPMVDHGAMSGCILFLTVGSALASFFAALRLLLLRTTAVAARRSVPAVRHRIRLRGPPPGPSPRFALGVCRI